MDTTDGHHTHEIENDITSLGESDSNINLIAPQLDSNDSSISNEEGSIENGPVHRIVMTLYFRSNEDNTYTDTHDVGIQTDIALPMPCTDSMSSSDIRHGLNQNRDEAQPVQETGDDPMIDLALAGHATLYYTRGRALALGVDIRM